LGVAGDFAHGKFTPRTLLSQSSRLLLRDDRLRFVLQNLATLQLAPPSPHTDQRVGCSSPRTLRSKVMLDLGRRKSSKRSLSMISCDWIGLSPVPSRRPFELSLRYSGPRCPTVRFFRPVLLDTARRLSACDLSTACEQRFDCQCSSTFSIVSGCSILRSPSAARPFGLSASVSCSFRSCSPLRTSNFARTVQPFDCSILSICGLRIRSTFQSISSAGPRPLQPRDLSTAQFHRPFAALCVRSFDRSHTSTQIPATG